MPVSVLQIQDAERFGHTDLYGALAEISAIGVGNSLLSSSTSWDSGATFINLRNLGTNRSLTLIDGKRRVSSSARSSAVDAPGIADPKVGPHVTTGGNPELGPETSDSLTVGFVWQPTFLPNFDLTVDYWDIDIKDVIYQLSYTQILNLCVDMPSIDNQDCAAQGRNLTPMFRPLSTAS